jgi:hypothetical protein
MFDPSTGLPLPQEVERFRVLLAGVDGAQRCLLEEIGRLRARLLELGAEDPPEEKRP